MSRWTEDERVRINHYKRMAKRTPEDRAARAAYMHQYYLDHPEKFPRRTQEQQDAYNAARRAKNAACETTRAKARADAKAWQDANPLMKKAQRLKNYGLSLAEFEAMLTRQDGGCAICGFADRTDSTKFPMVDHCHKSGVVRGLLCARCNFAVGLFDDDPGRARKAADYLALFGGGA